MLVTHRLNHLYVLLHKPIQVSRGFAHCSVYLQPVMLSIVCSASGTTTEISAHPQASTEGIIQNRR